MALVAVFVESFISVLAQALSLVIVVRVLLSWVPARLPWGLGEFVSGVSEPILAPIRRALPAMGGMDFSPLVALFGIQIAASLLLQLVTATF